MTTTYTPTPDIDPTGQAYTWSELQELLAHWHRQGEAVPSEIRELSDGRVVGAAWDPADSDPTVVAWRNA